MGVSTKENIVVKCDSLSLTYIFKLSVVVVCILVVAISPFSAQVARAASAVAVVDDTANVLGYYAGVALQNNGNAMMVHYDSTAQDLRYAECTNIDCSTKNITVLDSTGNVGQYSSIAIGHDGFARIAYYDGISTNRNLKYIQCTSLDCTSNNMTTVDTTRYSGQRTSIVIGADGFARIAHSDGYGLRYAQCLNDACTSSNTTQVDPTDHGNFRSISLDLGADGYPRVAYSTGSPSVTLRYAQCLNDACTSSNLTALDSTDIGYSSAISVSTDGYARIAYDGYNTHDLRYMQCLNDDCTSRSQTTIDALDGVGYYITMITDSAGYSRIAYHDNITGDFKYARCLNESCTSRSVTMPSPSDNADGFESIAIGADGYVRIAYMGGSYDNLMLWIEETTITPSIYSVSPPSGSIVGGDAVMISGANFLPSTTLKIGGISVSATYVNSSTLTATTPAHAVGAVDVAVYNGSASATLADGYTYVASDGSASWQITGRKLTISKSNPASSNPTTNYEFTMNVPSIGTSIKSIAAEICTTASTACVKPTGFSGSSANMGTVSGLAGTWADESIDGTLKMKNSIGSLPSNPIVFTFTDVQNPTTPNQQTFFARVTTYSDDSYATSIDYGVVAASTANLMNITGQVDEVLVFCVGTSGITTTSCDGVTGTNVDLGKLSSTSTSTGTSLIGINTNANGGYVITYAGNTLTDSSSSNTITNMSTAASSTFGTEQFGMNLVSNTTPNVGYMPDGAGLANPFTGYSTTNVFKFLSGDVIVSRSSSDDFRRFTVSYIANISGVTEAGTYMTSLDYVGTCTF
jgi:hypothetical protein